MDESTLAWAFGGVLLTFALSLLGLRRAATRRQVALAAATPLAAFVAYEAMVHQVMPYADIRVDWLLLLPIAIVHGLHASARWRRLADAPVD